MRAALVADEAVVFELVDAEVDDVPEQHHQDGRENQHPWQWQSLGSREGHAERATDDEHERQIDKATADVMPAGPGLVLRQGLIVKHHLWERASKIVVRSKLMCRGSNL